MAALSPPNAEQPVDGRVEPGPTRESALRPGSSHSGNAPEQPSFVFAVWFLSALRRAYVLPGRSSVGFFVGHTRRGSSSVHVHWAFDALLENLDLLPALTAL